MENVAPSAAAETGDPADRFAFGFLEFEEKPGEVGGFGALRAPVQNGTLPTPALMAEIAIWLSIHFDLPASGEQPRVEFASVMKLAAMKYGGFSAPSTRLNPSTPLNLGSDLVAVYHDAKRTIYLPESWTSESPADVSILVHEMVHHLQNVNAVKYDCAAAREKPAYMAQNRWLQRFGQDLETAFEVDLFTVVVKSACMFP